MQRGVAPPPPRLLREAEAAGYVSLSVTAFRREWEAGRAPPPVRVTAGRQAWLIDTLNAYIATLVAACPDLTKWMRAHPQADPAAAAGGIRARTAEEAEWDAAVAECDAIFFGDRRLPPPAYSPAPAPGARRHRRTKP